MQFWASNSANWAASRVTGVVQADMMRCDASRTEGIAADQLATNTPSAGGGSGATLGRGVTPPMHGVVSVCA